MNLSELIEGAKLPASIDVVTKLQQSIASGIESAADFAAKLQTDASLSARVLKIANSAYYNRNSVDSIEEAVVLIGENDLTALVISSEIIAAFETDNHRINMEDFWSENIFAAISAKIIARRTGKDKATLFTASLLRRTGQLVIYRSVPEMADKILTAHKNNPEQLLHTVEKSVLGFNHAEVSATLLRKWEIPESVTTPIEHYLSPDQLNGNYRKDAAILHLSHQHAQKKFEHPEPEWIDPAWFKSTLEIPPEALLAEAGEEIQLHYERTLAMVLN